MFCSDTAVPDKMLKYIYIFCTFIKIIKIPHHCLYLTSQVTELHPGICLATNCHIVGSVMDSRLWAVGRCVRGWVSHMEIGALIQ